MNRSFKLTCCVGLVLILLTVYSGKDEPSELKTVFDDSQEYRFPTDTEMVDDPPSGWAFSAHVQRDSGGDIERIDVPNNAVVRRVKDGWSIELPKAVPRDLYDSESYLPRGNHLYRRQFTAKQWAEKKLLEKFFRADSGQHVDFEAHGIHTDSADDWNRNYDTVIAPQADSKEAVSPIFGGIRDCEDIECYMNRVKDDSDESVSVVPDKAATPDVVEADKGLNAQSSDRQAADKDISNEGCGVSCLISFLANAVASKRPRPAKELDPVSDSSPAKDVSAQEDDLGRADSTDSDIEDSSDNHVDADTERKVRGERNRDESGTPDVQRQVESHQNDIQIRRSADGRIAEILIPSDAILSSSPSGLSIRPRKQARDKHSSLQALQTQHESLDTTRRAIVDAYAPNQDPYYCMHGNLEIECGTGPPDRAPRHDYTLGWQKSDGSMAPSHDAITVGNAGKSLSSTGYAGQVSSRKDAGKFSSRGLRRVVRDFVNALRDSIEGDRPAKQVSFKSAASKKSVQPLDSKLRSRQSELARRLKEYEEQIQDLKSIVGISGASPKVSAAADSSRPVQDVPAESGSDNRATNRLLAENAALARRLQEAKTRLARMQYMLSMGQTQDRATAPLPPPRAESLAMLPAHRRGPASGGFLVSWLHAAEANDLARLRDVRGPAKYESLAHYDQLNVRPPMETSEAPTSSIRPGVGDTVAERASELAVDAAAAAELERQAKDHSTSSRVGFPVMISCSLSISCDTRSCRRIEPD